MVTCLAFIAIATYIAYRGITTTERVQSVLVGFQMIVLLLFVVVALVAAPATPDRDRFDLVVVQPVHRAGPIGVHRRAVGSIFAFWGWDTA